MKRKTAEWVRYAEEDWQVANDLAGKTPPRRNAVCFHCQQAGEKYVKALLQDLGVAVPRTHNLKLLIDMLLPHDATLAPLRPRAASLTKYAVEYRYPGMRATTRQMQSALKAAERVREREQRRLVSAFPG